MLSLFLCFISLLNAACDVIFTSPELRGTFRQTSDASVFFDGENYLFAESLNGVRKWIIADSKEDGERTVVGEITSHAHHPVDIQVVSPFAKWDIDDYGDKLQVEAKWVNSECGDFDTSVYISSRVNPDVDGFYQFRTDRINGHPTFQSENLYLFYISSSGRYERWMISHDYGTDSGIAYVDHAKSHPHNTDGTWTVSTSNGWQPDTTLKLERSMFERSSWRSLQFRRHADLKEIGTPTHELRNGLQIPKMMVDGQKIQKSFNFRVAASNKYRGFLVKPLQAGILKNSVANRLFSAVLLSGKTLSSVQKEFKQALEGFSKSFVDCLVVDLSANNDAELGQIWSYLEKQYADGKTLCVATTGNDLDKIKTLSKRALPPHFMMIGEVTSADFMAEIKEIASEQEMKLIFDNALVGAHFDSKRTELNIVAQSQRTVKATVYSSWLINNGFGASFTLIPSAKLIDSDNIFRYKFQETGKDEL